MKIGDNVIFNKEMPLLDKGTVGLIYTIHDDWAVVVYPQNSLYESDGKGGWKFINGKRIQVYSHSARLTDLTPHSKQIR